MKAIKIGLAILVIGTIAFFVFKSIGTTNEVNEIPPPENQFVARILDEIDSIDALQNNEFNTEIYDNIKYLIDDHSKPHSPKYTYGRLGETQLENDQQKDNLTRNLYSAYVAKFLGQAFYVFNNSVWSHADLTFIRSEYRSLRSSPYLESGSPVDNRLGEIQRVFQKYDEINDFISSCNRFSFPDPSSSLKETEDNNYIELIRGHLDQVNTYRINPLSNMYLRNCLRLRTGLNAIPQTLFQKHVQYLNDRITAWSGFYKERITTQIMYRRTLYDPLIAEIAEVDSNLYGNTISTMDDERIRLLEKWNTDASLAYIFLLNKQKNIKNENN